MWASNWIDLSEIDFNLTFILTIAAFIAAFGTIWKTARFFFRVDRALPVLLHIAEQFENNSGSTIKDKIDDLHSNQAVIKSDLEKRYSELNIADRFALSIAEDSRTIANTNAAIVKELSETSVTEMLHIKEYMHENMHNIRNTMTGSMYFAKGLDARMARLESQLDTIIPLISRHRQSDTRDSGATDE